jgi:hypothetical protein
MAIDARWASMGSPSGVCNASVRVKHLLLIQLGGIDKFSQLGDFANLLEGKHLILLVSVDGKAGRIIATVLEAG